MGPELWGRGMGPVVEHLRLPHHAPGLGVEGEDVVVGAGVEDRRAVDGDVPVVLPEGVEDVVADVVGHLAAVLPDQVAGDRVDGLDDVGGVRHVEDAAVGERRALLSPLGEGAGPDHAQVADVVAVDLVEGTVAPPVEGAAPHQPVAGGGVLEHLVSDRHEARVFIGLRHRRERRERNEGKHRERESETLSQHRELLRHVKSCARAWYHADRFDPPEHGGPSQHRRGRFSAQPPAPTAPVGFRRQPWKPALASSGPGSSSRRVDRSQSRRVC